MSMRRLVVVCVVLAVCGTAAAMAQTPPQLFYLKKIPGGVAVCASGPQGGEQRVIRELNEASGAQWSPNGRYLAFVQRAAAGAIDSLFVVDCTTGGAFAANSPGQQLLGFNWSERSDRIFYFCGDPQSRAYDLYTRVLDPAAQPVHLGGGIKTLAVSPVCSADGRWVAFPVADEERPRQVAVADLTTGEARVASGQLYVDSHQWSPTGARLTLIARTSPVGSKDSRPRLYLADPGGEPRLISAEDQTVRACIWQPTGQMMAYMTAIGAVADAPAEGDGRGGQLVVDRTWVYLAPADGSTPPSRVAAISDAVRFMWAPNGSYFVVTDQAHGDGESVPTLRVGSVTGNLRVPALVSNSVGAAYEVWAPDSSRLLFMQKGDVYTFDPTIRHSKLLVNSLPIRNLSWSPKSDSLMLVTPYAPAGAEKWEGDVTVWRVDTDGKGRPITNAFKQGALDWAPDGSSLMLVIPTSEETCALYHVDPDAAAPALPADMEIARDVLIATWYPKE